MHRRDITGQPPPLKRERRPRAEAAHLENTLKSNSSPAYSQPLASLKAAALRRRQRQRHVQRIYQLGPRAIAELLDELDRHYGFGIDLDHRLARYARLDQAIVIALGGHLFPAAPLRIVAGPP